MIKEEVIAWFIAIIDSTGLKFQFVTKHHHWLFGQNRTSLNALLLTRIKIGEDKPNQCSKTITWCNYLFTLSFSIPPSSARTYASCVPDCTHTWSEKCYKYKESVFSIDIATKDISFCLKLLANFYETLCALSCRSWYCTLCNSIKKRIIKPLFSYCLLEGKSLLTENHSPTPFIYPVWCSLIFPDFICLLSVNSTFLQFQLQEW